jgi:hypothetical protein
MLEQSQNMIISYNPSPQEEAMELIAHRTHHHSSKQTTTKRTKMLERSQNDHIYIIIHPCVYHSNKFLEKTTNLVTSMFGYIRTLS